MRMRREWMRLQRRIKTQFKGLTVGKAIEQKVQALISSSKASTEILESSAMFHEIKTWPKKVA